MSSIIRTYPDGRVANSKFMTSRQVEIAKLSDVELNCRFMDAHFDDPDYADLEHELYLRGADI